MTSTIVTDSVAPIGKPIAAPRVRLGLVDPAAAFAGATLLLMFVVPGRYAFGPHGVRLSTTIALGLVALLTWISYLVFGGAIRQSARHRLNPMRLALLVYVAGTILSAAIAYRRPLTGLESSGVLRVFVLLIAYCGLGLLICDGVRSADGLRRMLDRVLVGAYLSAVVAIGQKLFQFGYVGYWAKVPGLYTALDSENGPVLSGRTVGTASHPIEFSVACACLIPFAVTQSGFATTERMARFHRTGIALLLIGSFLGVSRAGFIGVVIVVILVVPRLAVRARVNALAFGILVLALIQVAAHGTLSTLRYQLLHIGTDASSKGRTADYGPVFDLVSQRRWQGLGLGTYNPKQYLFLDNSWLGLLVTGGIIGVVILGGVLLTGLYTAGRVGHQLPGTYVGSVAQAAGTMLLVLGVCAYFFDELSFPQTTTLIFVCLGILGLTSSLAKESVSATSGQGVHDG